jgi:DNA-binding transcriptional MerR regulator
VGLPRTYTLRELETLSGFDKRTIAYYIQESLLLKVGRRGRRTRYPEEFLDRLMFIRRVRDLQDSGQLRAVTLNEIRRVIDGQSPEETRRASREGASAETLRVLFAEPDLDTSSFEVAAEELASLAMTEPSAADAAPRRLASLDASSANSSRGNRRRSRVSRGRALGETKLRFLASPPLQSADPSDLELKALLQEVGSRARLGAKESEGQVSERWTRVPITEEILLSVCNISDEDAHLVEELAELLRHIGESD